MTGSIKSSDLRRCNFTLPDRGTLDNLLGVAKYLGALTELTRPRAIWIDAPD